jgi:hypothetical protein
MVQVLLLLLFFLVFGIVCRLARSVAWVYGRPVAGIEGSNPAGGHGCLSLVRVVCCQVEVCASGCSYVQRSSTDCGAFYCDGEASIMRRPWPTLRRGKEVLTLCPIVVSSQIMSHLPKYLLGGRGCVR